MNCKKCKSNEATIHVENVGDFCLNCHNDDMAKLLKVKKTTDFSNSISVYDADGIIHWYDISNMHMPSFSVWKAQETGGDYQFEVLVKPEQNQVLAIEHLHQKILTGMGYKTLEHISDKFFINNAIRIDKEQYSLNSVGTLRIENAEDDHTACLIIDGKNIPLYDFGRALTEFEGFNMDFHIRDLSEEVLGKDMVLRPTSINSEVIMEHFEKTLGWFLVGDFLSYKQESACEEALFERIAELELLWRYGKREEAVEVGKKMKNRLMSIDNNTDDFPNYLLEMIDQVIGNA